MTFEDLHVIGRGRHLVNINMKTPNRPFYFEKAFLIKIINTSNKDIFEHHAPRAADFR